MNLQILLDITNNPCKKFKFYSHQGQNVQIFQIFTYNQDKIFLILPITRGEHMYIWSPLRVSPGLLKLIDLISFLSNFVQFSDTNFL